MGQKYIAVAFESPAARCRFRCLLVAIINQAVGAENQDHDNPDNSETPG